MKFDEHFIALLKHMATINPSLYFKKGTMLKSMSPKKTVIATIHSDTQIEFDFCVYDLMKFVGVLELFGSKIPDIELKNDNYLEISNGSNRSTYLCTDPRNIITPPDKKLKLDDPIYEFELTHEVLAKVMKAANVLQISEICIASDGEKVYLKTVNSADSTSNQFSIEIGECSKHFSIFIKTENTKLLPLTYNVKILRNMTVFESKNAEFIIASEAHSEYA